MFYVNCYLYLVCTETAREIPAVVVLIHLETGVWAAVFSRCHDEEALGAFVDRQCTFLLLCSVSSLSTWCAIVRPAGCSFRPFRQVRISITMAGSATGTLHNSHSAVSHLGQYSHKNPLPVAELRDNRSYDLFSYRNGWEVEVEVEQTSRSSLLYYKPKQVELRSRLHFTDNLIWASMYCTYLINFLYFQNHKDSFNCLKWLTSLKYAALS